MPIAAPQLDRDRQLALARANAKGEVEPVGGGFTARKAQPLDDGRAAGKQRLDQREHVRHGIPEHVRALRRGLEPHRQPARRFRERAGMQPLEGGEGVWPLAVLPEQQPASVEGVRELSRGGAEIRSRP
jgi:hypothetical protein